MNYRLWNISYIKYFFYFLNSLITYKYSDKIIVTTSEIKEFVIKSDGDLSCIMDFKTSLGILERSTD